DHVSHVHLSRNACVIHRQATAVWFEGLILRRRDYGWMLWRRETATNVTRKLLGSALPGTTSLEGSGHAAHSVCVAPKIGYGSPMSTRLEFQGEQHDAKSLDRGGAEWPLEPRAAAGHSRYD